VKGDALPAHAHALALMLCHCEHAAPLSVRAAWLAFLRRHEGHPEDLRRALQDARAAGHVRAGQLTPAGVRVALQALGGGAVPPRSIRGPQSGAGRSDHGKP